VLTASYVAFAHGANNVANMVGPVAAAVHIAPTGSVSGEIPARVLLLGGCGIVASAGSSSAC
jgi:phosphate/sulfate permease